MSKLERQRGYDYGRGMVLGIIDALIPILIVAFIALAIINTFNWFTDDSDKSGWDRSGVRIYEDAKTGQQYLGTSGGGIIKREIERGALKPPRPID